MAPLKLVHITGVKEDGSSFLLRRWAEVMVIRNPGGGIGRIDIELVQNALWGLPYGEQTQAELDRCRTRSAELEHARRQEERTRDREAWQEQIGRAHV